MKIYNFDKDTKEYLYETEALPDPVETQRHGTFVPLIPANGTLNEPLPCASEQINVFLNNSWAVKSDFRGQKQVKLSDLTVSEIKDIGDIQAGYQKISNETAEQLKQDPDRFKVIDGVLTDIYDTEEYKEKVKQRERKRLDGLSMTPLDFIKGLEKFGVTYQQIKNLCDNNIEVDKQLRFCNSVFRGNPLLNQLCGQFGITPEQLDVMFDTHITTEEE